MTAPHRSVSAIFREYAGHEAERNSPLMLALLTAAADDWDAGGITREVLAPYLQDDPGSSLPLRFAAALHRVVLHGEAPELARYYRTAGGMEAPQKAWAAARRVLAAKGDEVRRLTSLPCQTNEVGRSVGLLIGLALICAETGPAVRLLEIGASAGLNLLVDRYRYGDRYGPVDSPCRLPDPGIAIPDLRIVDPAGCDLSPLDPTSEEGRLRLSSSIWGDQPERLERLRGALAVAATARVSVTKAHAEEWLREQLADRTSRNAAPATVVWHSVIRTYVEAGEWQGIEELTARPGVWRLSYEPDDADLRRMALRLYSESTPQDGELLAYGGAHGPPITLDGSARRID